MNITVSVRNCFGPKGKCQIVTAFAEMACIAGVIISKIGAVELIY